MLRMTAAALKRLQGAANVPARRKSASACHVEAKAAQIEVRLDHPRGLVLPHPPTSNHRLMPIDGRMVKSTASREYADEVVREARKVFSEPVTVPVEVAIVVHPRSRNYSDLDNLTKQAFDAMTGVVWKDDSQVWRLEIERGEVVPGGRLTMVVKSFER